MRSSRFVIKGPKERCTSGNSRNTRNRKPMDGENGEINKKRLRRVVEIRKGGGCIVADRSIQVSYESCNICSELSFVPYPVPPLFLSSTRSRPAHHDLPLPRPSPTPVELSSRPLKAFPKLLTNSRTRKSRLLEISFHESSLPLGMYAPQFVKRRLSLPLHPHSTTRPSDRHFLSFTDVSRPSAPLKASPLAEKYHC